MKMGTIALTLACLLLCSCSTDRWAEVRSDTDWSGYFDDHSVDGSGDRDIPLDEDRSPSCVVIQKQTAAGTLRVRLVEEGFGPWGDNATGWASTTAEYGVCHVCFQ